LPRHRDGEVRLRGDQVVVAVVAEVDPDPLDGAREPVVEGRVVRRDRRAAVAADVGGLVEGEEGDVRAPNALDAPKPTSSNRTISTFGAPAGGRSGSIAGNAVSGSFAS
jgi:hypothetical protein